MAGVEAPSDELVEAELLGTGDVVGDAADSSANQCDAPAESVLTSRFVAARVGASPALWPACQSGELVDGGAEDDHVIAAQFAPALPGRNILASTSPVSASIPTSE